jgi:hypothetical protein
VTKKKTQVEILEIDHRKNVLAAAFDALAKEKRQERARAAAILRMIRIEVKGFDGIISVSELDDSDAGEFYVETASGSAFGIVVTPL